MHPAPTILIQGKLQLLQDAVEGIITAFLLPARELKTMQTVKQRVMHYGAKNPLLASLQQTSLSRTSSGNHEGLIKAINPLAGGWQGGAP